MRQTVKQNKSIREKVGEILQRIADKVMSYFKGDKANGLLAHNRYAQIFLDDAKALQEMAQIPELFCCEGLRFKSVCGTVISMSLLYFCTRSRILTFVRDSSSFLFFT